MMTPEMLAQIRRIELHSRRLVQNTFAGAYRSVFKGRGIAFDTVRPYTPGDDVRDIDWNVTARSGEAFIKQYAEERELTLLLLFDTSASTTFGTRVRQKRELAAELGAVLALAAATSGDRAGLLTFGSQLDIFVPPRKGERHVLRIIRELLAAESSAGSTDLAAALAAVNRAVKRRAVVFLISDFLAPPESYSHALRLTSLHHDVVAIGVHDPLEQRWQNSGLVTLKDAETGALLTVDSASAAWRARFEQQADDAETARRAAFARAGVDYLALSTTDDYAPLLLAFLRRRAPEARRSGRA